MKVKLIDFGIKDLPDYLPIRKHYNDAGLDVYHINEDWALLPGETKAFGLGFGVEIPDGYVGFIFPRSGLAKEGIVCELPPIDSGYRGEIHAVVTNCGTKTYTVRHGARIGQLVILPCAIADLSFDLGEERNQGAFGSTGV